MINNQEKKIESLDPRGEMDFFGHLNTLRKVILYSLIILSVTSVIAYLFSPELLQTLNQPFIEKFPKNSLIGTSPSEAFVLKIKVAIFFGFLLASPAIFLLLWSFIKPALYPSEQKLVLPLASLTCILFFIGALFCFHLILPIAFAFFASQYDSLPQVVPAIKITEQINIVLSFTFVCGVIFEMPIIAFILARLKLISYQGLLAYWRHAICAIFIIAAIFSPPDIFSQILLAIPMTFLYVISLIVVKKFC
ncbi:MAG TPA: twin-arginine translocase subunit TatC [Oligoflexia bacterium]|nr:twin-arginine translocase subunit TatC [Oligoflexia bacterium]